MTAGPGVNLLELGTFSNYLPNLSTAFVWHCQTGRWYGGRFQKFCPGAISAKAAHPCRYLRYFDINLFSYSLPEAIGRLLKPRGKSGEA